MKSRGVYYMPRADKIIIITRVGYYCKEATKKPFTRCTWIDENGEFPKTVIFETQFKQFIRIGDL